MSARFVGLQAGYVPSLEARRRRKMLVQDLAEQQNYVVSRRQLLALGLTRWDVRAELTAGRWRAHHRQTIAVHTGQLIDRARLWHAVIEAGTRSALDGTGALVAAGLTGFEVDTIRVSVPRGAKVLQAPGTRVRQTRRLKPDDVIRAGIPRVHAPVAAVRAALWATTDRQAALLLAMTVQQRLATADQIASALLGVRRDRRRKMLERVVLDLLGGAQSLGEIDVARHARARGLPEPDRQLVRRGRNGHYYLDALWTRFGVALEVDGIHHVAADSIVGDALRQNELSLQGLTVLRLPLLGLRARPDEFFAQIEQALRRAGWMDTLDVIPAVRD